MFFWLWSYQESLNVQFRSGAGTLCSTDRKCPTTDSHQSEFVQLRGPLKLPFTWCSTEGIGGSMVGRLLCAIVQGFIGLLG